MQIPVTVTIRIEKRWIIYPISWFILYPLALTGKVPDWATKLLARWGFTYTVAA